VEFLVAALKGPDVEGERGYLVDIGDGLEVFRKIDVVEIVLAGITNLGL
jgi:hypothetical protein